MMVLVGTGNIRDGAGKLADICGYFSRSGWNKVMSLAGIVSGDETWLRWIRIGDCGAAS